MVIEGSRPFLPGPVKGTAFAIRDVFFRFVATIRLQQLPDRVFRRRLGCPPLASRTIRLSAFERQATNEIRILQPDELRRAGTTHRAQDPLPRRCCRPVRASTVLPARRATSVYIYVRSVPRSTLHPFTRWCAFRDRAGSRFRYEPTTHLPGCDVPGTSPDCATFVDGAHHFFTTRRLATTRRAIMASDVGRGLRAAACRQREGPVRAHSSREWNVAGSPPRGRPRTLFVIDPGA